MVRARPRTDVSGRPLALRDVDLDAFLNPKAIAVIGASEQSRKPNTAMTRKFDAWAKERPLVVVCADQDENLARSFRNLQKVVVVAPSELDVAAVVWARSLLVSQAALSGVLARAGAAAEETPEEVSA